MSERKPRKAKKRGQNEGSIRKRDDGRWEARHMLPGGRRLSLYGKTREEVQAKLRDAERETDAGHDPNAGRQLVGEFLEHWFRTVATPRLRPSTLKSHRSYLDNHILPDLGPYQLKRLTPQRVQTFLNAKSAAGLKPRTVQQLRAILRTALNQALKWGLVTRNVATLVDPPRTEKEEISPLSPVECQAFLASIKQDRLKAMYLVAVMLGLRQGELLGLRWADVDLARGELRVRYAMQRIDREWRFVEPKTQRSRRSLPLPDVVITALTAHRELQAEYRLGAGDRWQEWDLVFPSTVGTPQQASNVTHRFQAKLEQAGIPRRRFHDLRHSCGTFLYASGVDPRTIMEILGHSQISLTMNTYVHGVTPVTRTALEAMERFLAPKTTPETSRLGSGWGQTRTRHRRGRGGDA